LFSALPFSYHPGRHFRVVAIVFFNQNVVKNNWQRFFDIGQLIAEDVEPWHAYSIENNKTTQ